MKQYTPGEIKPGITFIGNPAVLLYLLVGEQTCLIDSGMTAMGPLLRKHLDQYIGGMDQLDQHFLTHAHYDHVGGTPLLCRENPTLTVGAHPTLADIVQRPNAIALIRQLNETVMGGPPTPDATDMLAFDGFQVTHEFFDGEIIDLGGMPIQVLFTPGHTRDSVTYYLPEHHMIIPGEAAGVPDTHDRIMPEFLQSYQSYMHSLDRLASLEVDAIGLPHNYVLTGDAARRYIARSIDASIAFRDQIETELDRHHGDTDMTITQMTQDLYHPGLGQPKDAFSLNLQAMVRTIAREFSR